MAKLNAPKWNGRKIAKEEDASDLESRSAIYEFKHRMPRGDAEHRAHHEYKLDKHREAAAFHLQGLKAAQHAGSQEEGHKHGLMYQLHMKALGHNPMDAVPHEIQSLADKQDKFYNFKPHRGDVFLLQGDDDEKVEKSELKKGTVLPFPGNPAPAVDQGKPATTATLPTPGQRLDGVHGADYTHVLKRHGVHVQGHSLTVNRHQDPNGQHVYTARLWNPDAEDHKDYAGEGTLRQFPTGEVNYEGFGDAWDPHGGDGSLDSFEPAVQEALHHAAGKPIR